MPTRDDVTDLARRAWHVHEAAYVDGAWAPHPQPGGVARAGYGRLVVGISAHDPERKARRDRHHRPDPP
jgi:hypothetical protein